MLTVKSIIQRQNGKPYMERALELDKNDWAGIANLGTDILMLGSHEADALLCYEKALEINPQSHTAWINRGNVTKQFGDFAGGLLCYKNALKVKKDSPYAWNNLGCIYRETGIMNRALACFRKATRLKPDYYDAHSNYLFCLTFVRELDVNLVELHKKYGEILDEQNKKND